MRESHFSSYTSYVAAILICFTTCLIGSTASTSQSSNIQQLNSRINKIRALQYQEIRCPHGKYLDEAKSLCNSCNRTCEECSGPLFSDCLTCDKSRIAIKSSALTNSSDVKETDVPVKAITFACLCPHGYNENKDGICEYTYEDTKRNISILISVFLVIFLFSYFALKMCPSEFKPKQKTNQQKKYTQSADKTTELAVPGSKKDFMDVEELKDQNYQRNSPLDTEGVAFVSQ